MNEVRVFRYLKFRSKRRFVRGTTVCRHLRIPLWRLSELDNHDGVGSMGPVDYFPKRRSLAIRHAKRNGYMADFRFFFESDYRYYCIKQRDLRKGCWPPKRNRRLKSS